METLNSFFVCQKSYISQSLSLDLASPLQNCVVLILDIFCHSGEQTEWAQFQPDMTKCVLVEDDPVTRDKGGSGEPVPSDVPLTVEPEKKQQGRSVRTMMMMMTCTAVPAYSRAQPKNQSKPEFLWSICPPPDRDCPGKGATRTSMTMGMMPRWLQKLGDLILWMQISPPKWNSLFCCKFARDSCANSFIRTLQIPKHSKKWFRILWLNNNNDDATRLLYSRGLKLVFYRQNTNSCVRLILKILSPGFASVRWTLVSV